MSYMITFVFKDEKQSTMSLPKDEVTKLFDCLMKGIVYENPETKRGYWTNINDIRWIITDLQPSNIEENNTKVEQIENVDDDQPEGE